MLTIGEIIKKTQPDIFFRLAKFFKPVQRKREVIISFEDAESLMKHDSFKRIGRAIKQVGRST